MLPNTKNKHKFPKIHIKKCSDIYTEIKNNSIGQIFLIPAKEGEVLRCKIGPTLY
jgi:hypothetical protein